MLDLIINKDKELTISVILKKDQNTGHLYNSAGGGSAKLEEMLEEVEK